MIIKYNKHQSGEPTRFAIGDCVTVFIPYQDRAATGDRCLPALIVVGIAINFKQYQGF